MENNDFNKEEVVEDLNNYNNINLEISAEHSIIDS
jgi:hypothetical protein